VYNSVDFYSASGENEPTMWSRGSNISSPAGSETDPRLVGYQRFMCDFDLQERNLVPLEISYLCLISNIVRFWWDRALDVHSVYSVHLYRGILLKEYPQNLVWNLEMSTVQQKCIFSLSKNSLEVTRGVASLNMGDASSVCL